MMFRAERSVLSCIASAKGALVRRVAAASVLALCLFLVYGCGSSTDGTTTSRPPSQPLTGPGGRDYDYGGVEAAQFGTGTEGYWIFTPTESQPPSAPVVVFLHAWTVTDPFVYRGWINHI